MTFKLFGGMYVAIYKGQEYPTFKKDIAEAIAEAWKMISGER